MSFLKELKDVPLLNELKSAVGYEHLIHWMNDNRQHQSFFDMIQQKYPSLFTHLDQDTTVLELTNALKAAIERKYRCDAINYHIRNISGIEERIMGVYDWHQHHSRQWFNQIHDFMPNYKPIGYQKLTLTEIAPMSKIDHHGEIGGKTVKIGDYKDMNNEIILSQRDALGKTALEIRENELQEIRDMSLQMFAARRFIFAEAIDMIMDFEDRRRGYDIAMLNKNDESFREAVYCSFASHSQDYLFKIHKAFNIHI